MRRIYDAPVTLPIPVQVEVYDYARGRWLPIESARYFDALDRGERPAHGQISISFSEEGLGPLEITLVNTRVVGDGAGD